MTEGRRPTTGWLSVVVSALLAGAFALFTNIFTNTLPEGWTWVHDPALVGTIVAVVFVGTIVIALVQQRGDSPGTTAITRLLGRFAGNYPRKYRRWVAEDRQAVDNSGLISVGPASPSLPAIFVDVKLTSRAPAQVSPGLLGADPVDARRRSVKDFLDGVAPAVLAVLGAPGSGKTTLLSHIAWETATSHGGRRPMPVFLLLRRHAPAIEENPGIDLAAVIRAGIPAGVGGGDDGWWENELRRGRCVVLLDGLDEVAGDRARRAVVRWVNAQIAVYPGNDYLLTSRPHGYREAFVNATDTVEVLPFTREQVREFLRRWYRLAERREDPYRDRERADARGLAAADRLVRQLDDIPGLHDLTVNPLLLTMVANVHRYQHQLPDNRAVLYREVCEVMLDRRERQKERVFRVPGPVRLSLLGGLAYAWMAAGVRGSSRQALIDSLSSQLAVAAPGVGADEFLAEIEETGLLLSPVAREYTFAHQTFQEYLAAQHIAAAERPDVLSARVDDPWWAECTLLYAAENDPNPIVASALDSGSETAHTLAFEIAESQEGIREAVPVSYELWGRLDAVLKKGLRRTSSPAERKVAANALLGRIMRSTLMTLDGSRICRQPVTVDLYDVFCLDTGTPPPEGPADEEVDAPARGMWGADAVAFVAWANGLLASGPRGAGGRAFRLPTVDELALLDRPGAYWVGPVAAPQPWKRRGRHLSDVRARELAEAMAPDLAGSALFDAALSRLVVRLAEEVRRSGEAVNRQAADLPSIATEFMRAESTVEGRAAGLAAAQTHSRSVVAGLDERTTDLRDAVEALIAALERGSGRDARVVEIVGEALTSVRLGRAQRHVLGAAGNSVNPDGVQLDGVGEDLRWIVALLAEARGLLARPPRPRPVAPLDQVLASAATVLPQLNIASADRQNPALGFAMALIPKGHRTENRTIPVDLGTLGRRLAAGAPAVPAAYREAADRLLRTASPLLSRHDPITPERAAAVRAPALIIARAAQQAGDVRFVLALLELAAAMCVLERRQRHPNAREGLILAFD